MTSYNQGKTVFYIDQTTSFLAFILTGTIGHSPGNAVNETVGYSLHQFSHLIITICREAPPYYPPSFFTLYNGLQWLNMKIAIRSELILKNEEQYWIQSKSTLLHQYMVHLTYPYRHFYGTKLQIFVSLSSLFRFFPLSKSFFHNNHLEGICTLTYKTHDGRRVGTNGQEISLFLKFCYI